MSHVKDLSLKVSCVGKKDVCLHLSMCLELEVLNFDFGLQSHGSFYKVISNYFSLFKDLVLPKVAREAYYHSDTSDDDYPDPPFNHNGG